MTYRTDAEILHIYHGLLDRTLPKTEWTHAAHFAAACAMIADPDKLAERDMPDIIRRYNVATGVANTDHEGYHHTITLASLGAARHYGGTSGHLKSRVKAALVSECGQSDWLLRYWSRDRLFSISARHDWTEPDLCGLSLKVTVGAT